MVNLGRIDNLMKNGKRDIGITKSGEANDTTKTTQTPQKTQTPTSTPTPKPTPTPKMPTPPPTLPNSTTVNTANDNSNKNDDINNVKEKDPVSQISPIAIIVMISIVVLVFLIIGILLYRKYLHYKKLRKQNENGLMIQPRTITSPLHDNHYRLNIGSSSSDRTASSSSNSHANDSTVVGSEIDYDVNYLGPIKKLPNKPPVIELNRISTYALKIDYNKFGYSKRNIPDTLNSNSNYNSHGDRNSNNINGVGSNNLTFPIPPQRTSRFYNIRDSIYSKFK